MRYLALDLGDKRIGIALSDTLGMIARPLEVIKRTSRINDFEYYNKLIDKHGIQEIIIGLPLNMDGTEGKQAHWVRDYASAFSQVADVPIIFWDERLTTEEARTIMKASRRNADMQNVDAVAAAIILQSYLDTHSAHVDNE